jgi:hypothetical protein
VRAQIYLLDGTAKTLSLLDRKSMSELGFHEPSDLETWLASCKDQLFSRKILWLARQDRPTDDQRSDIIGLSDEGDLVIAELKRGQANELAITQLLAYAAEYSLKTRAQLAQLYFEHSQKTGATELIGKAASLPDAESRISEHVREKEEDEEVNQHQILLILAEGFEEKALTICDYLTRTIGEEAKFSMELWQYGLYVLGEADAAKKHVFVLEKVFPPPPSLREQIKAKRENEERSASDPERVAFIDELVQHLSEKGMDARRSYNYQAAIRIHGREVWFNAQRSLPHPRIEIPDSLEAAESSTPAGLKRGKDPNTSNWWLEFSDLDGNKLKFASEIGDQVLAVVKALKPVADTPLGSSATPDGPQAKS